MSRPKKLLHCVKIKLLTTSEEETLLDDLQRSFRETYNQYLLLLEENGLLEKKELELYPVQHQLLENTRQSARDVAIESVRSYLELKVTDKRVQFPKQSDQPLSTRLNYRDGYTISKEGIVRISVRKGVRVHLSYEFDPKNRIYFKQAFEKIFRFGSSVLVRKKGIFYLHVNIGIGYPPYPAQGVDYTFIGVDVNEKNLALSAMSSTGKLLKSVILEFTPINARKQAAFTTRKRLGKAKQSALILQLGDKEKRWTTDLYHKLTTFAIQWVLAENFTNPFLILEDLTWIRKRMRFGKRMNRRLHSWGFRQIQEMLRYKAHKAGMPVYDVSPFHTSQRCPLCQTTKRSHKKKRRFQCSNRNCQNTDHRDRNATINIAIRGMLNFLRLKQVSTLFKLEYCKIIKLRWLTAGYMIKPLTALRRLIGQVDTLPCIGRGQLINDLNVLQAA